MDLETTSLLRGALPAPPLLAADHLAPQTKSDVPSNHVGRRLATLGVCAGAIAATAASGALLVSLERSFPTALLIALLHWSGAGLWSWSILGLVLANRYGVGPFRTRLLLSAKCRHGRHAAAGIALLTATGIAQAHGNPLGAALFRLHATGLGLAYLLTFTAKSVLVVASVSTSARIEARLRRMPTPTWRLRPTTASYGGDLEVSVFRLAETNALFAVGIVACSVALTTLHGAIA